MAINKKTTNGVNQKNGHVQLAREEYDAFMAREESYAVLTGDHAKAVNRVHDLTETCNAQSQRMQEYDQKVSNLERVNGLQKVFIDLIRADAPKVAALEDLSEFWRQWIIHTGKSIDARKATREEVAKFEPDLFRSWRNWINDASKADRVLGVAGSQMTRAEYEAAMPKNPKEWNEHTIRRLREENAKLTQRTQQLESEIENYKAVVAAQKAQSNNQPQGKP